MFGIIASLLQGIVSGVVGPMFGWLNKKQDVSLAGFQSANDADKANYTAWVEYQLQLQQLKIASNQWIGPKICYLVIGITASVHLAAVFIDSTFLFHWHIAQCPHPYDSYEAMVAGSLFVTALAYGPLNAATAWLHRK